MLKLRAFTLRGAPLLAVMGSLVAVPTIAYSQTYEIPSPPPQSEGGPAPVSISPNGDPEVGVSTGCAGPDACSGTMSLGGGSGTRSLRAAADLGSATYKLAPGTKALVKVPLNENGVAGVATAPGGSLPLVPTAATKNADGTTTTTRLKAVTASASPAVLAKVVAKALADDPSLADAISKNNPAALKSALDANPSLKAAVNKANPGLAGKLAKALKALSGSYRVVGGVVKVSGKAAAGTLVTVKVVTKQGRTQRTRTRKIRASKAGRYAITQSVKGSRVIKVTAATYRHKQINLRRRALT